MQLQSVDNRPVGRRVSSPDLVGRGGELEELREVLDAAAAGQAGFALVAGESGIGKSRLVSELAAAAERAGARTLIGECVELSAGEIPFAPIASAFRRLAREFDGDLTAELGPVVTELAAVFPELGASTAVVQPAALDSMGQARLFELMLRLLQRLSEEQPLVLVVEDLHWGDRSTRDLLLFLARNLRDERLLVIVTYRSDELHRRHPLRPFLPQLESMRTVARIDLVSLSRAEAAAQIERILGHEPAAATLDAIYERSEGNPFFTEELLAASPAGEPGGALPATLRDALLLRVEMLSPEAQELLRIAAAAGRRVQHRLLAEVTELPERELLGALREAVEAQLLVEASDDSYEFRHALLREAVYLDLLPGERGKLHGALGHALEREPRLGGQRGAVAAELAAHWYAAHELRRALGASIDAGFEAERRYAFAEAQQHLERALELWDTVEDAEAVRERSRVELLRRAAEAAHQAGDPERAVALAREVVAIADADEDALASALARERLGRYLWIGGRGVDALPVLREAAALVPPDPTAERARVLAALGQALMLSDQPAEAKQLCNDALEIARSTGARAVETNALNTLVACAGSNTGDTAAALEAMTAALAIAQELGLLEEISRAYINGSDALDQAGRVEEAVQLAFDGIASAQRLGTDRTSGHFLRAEAGQRLMRLGRWDEAEALAAEVLTAGASQLPSIIAANLQAELAVHRGDVERARVMIEQARTLASRAAGSMWQGPVAETIAQIALVEDHPEDARTAVEQGLAIETGGEYLYFTAALYQLGLRTEADIAERARPRKDAAALEAADARARALIERFERLLGEFGDNEPPPLARAHWATARAELGRLRQENDPEAWLDAVRRFDELGQVHDAAYARYRAAEALLASSGGRDQAQPLLVEARAVAERLRLRPLLAEIDALGRRGRISLSGAGTPAAADEATRPEAGFGLTPRELEVLELVAAGCTNREIGERLFMSEKTASVHVSRILSKLSAANRAEAAASAHRLGLVTHG